MPQRCRHDHALTFRATLTRIFGDSVSVTWERYLKVDKSRQISQWTRDLAKAIGEGTD